MSQSAIISRSLDVMSGTPVFTKTRVPVQTLFDYLKAGDSIDDFLEGFPTVERKQVISFLQVAYKQAQIFTKTRVPVQTLFDYLKAGDSIDDFLGGFPTVEREQVITFLETAQAQISKLVI